jgi:hypothetical protein
LGNGAKIGANMEEEYRELRTTLGQDVATFSFTFVSSETLDNIFPLEEMEINICEPTITINKTIPIDLIKSSMMEKISRYSDIWKELANY